METEELKIEVEVRGIDPEGVYTYEDVARMTGRSKNHLYVLQRSGKLPTAHPQMRVMTGTQVIEWIRSEVRKAWTPR